MPASVIASTGLEEVRRAEPERAVAGVLLGSGTRSVLPTAPKISSAWARCASVRAAGGDDGHGLVDRRGVRHDTDDRGAAAGRSSKKEVDAAAPLMINGRRDCGASSSEEVPCPVFDREDQGVRVLAASGW